MISLFGRKKTELTILVAIIMLMAISPTMASAAPSDISDHWAETYIDEWLDKGLITGYPDGTFKPDNKITRAEFMVLVNGAFVYTDKVTVDYTDVSVTDWYADTVAKARAAGYITGYTDGTIKPNKQISRQEAAVIIMKVNNLAQTETVADKFTDSSNIPSWSKGAIGATIAAGIMGGYPDGSFKAANPITRAEAVVALNKALNAKIPVIPDISNGSEIYDLTGTYGPAIGSRTVQGDVTIKVPGVTLQNIVIEGNLIIGKEVADGKATFKNIIVKGNTYIYGGGVNSIYFFDSQTGKTYVIKDDGPVRIVVAGTTEISQLIAQSSLTVAEVDLTGEGVEEIIVNRQVDGQIEINLSNATVDNLEINSPGVTIITNSNTTIGTLVTEASVKVTGKGTIENAVINANGVTFETKPESQTIASGISSPTITTGISSSDGSSGGNSGSPPRVQPAISPSVYLLNKNIISDIPVNITWGSARKIIGITGSALGGALKLYPKENIDYIVKDNTDGTGLLTIKSNKLSQLLPIPITAVPDRTSLTLIIKFDYGEKSLDIIVVSDTSQPFISPTKFVFNKNVPADIPIKIYWGPAIKVNKINGSAVGGKVNIDLQEGTHYTVKNYNNGTGLLTIKKEIINLLPVPITMVPDGAEIVLTIKFDQGEKNLRILVYGGDGLPTIIILTEIIDKNNILDVPIDVYWGTGISRPTEITGVTVLVIDQTIHLVEGEDYTVTDNGDGTTFLIIKKEWVRLLSFPISKISDATEITFTVEFDLGKKDFVIPVCSIGGIRVITKPTKVVYKEGEQLDLTGLVVGISQTTSLTELVALEQFADKNISTSPINGAELTTADTKVVISLNEKTTYQPITVEPVIPYIPGRICTEIELMEESGKMSNDLITQSVIDLSQIESRGSVDATVYESVYENITVNTFTGLIMQTPSSCTDKITRFVFELTNHYRLQNTDLALQVSSDRLTVRVYTYGQYKNQTMDAVIAGLPDCLNHAPYDAYMGESGDGIDDSWIELYYPNNWLLRYS